MTTKSKEPWFYVRVQTDGYVVDDLPVTSPVIPQIGDTFLSPPRETYKPGGQYFPPQAFKVVDRIITGSIEDPGIMRVAVIVEPVEIEAWKLELA